MALFQNTIHYITGRQQGRQDQGSHSIYFQDEESTGSVLDLLTGYSELIWAHLQKKPVFTPGSHPSAAYTLSCVRGSGEETAPFAQHPTEAIRDATSRSTSWSCGTGDIWFSAPEGRQRTAHTFHHSGMGMK